MCERGEAQCGEICFNWFCLLCAYAQRPWGKDCERNLGAAGCYPFYYLSLPALHMQSLEGPLSRAWPAPSNTEHEYITLLWSLRSVKVCFSLWNPAEQALIFVFSSPDLVDCQKYYTTTSALSAHEKSWYNYVSLYIDLLKESDIILIS